MEFCSNGSFGISTDTDRRCRGIPGTWGLGGLGGLCSETLAETFRAASWPPSLLPDRVIFDSPTQESLQHLFAVDYRSTPHLGMRKRECRISPSPTSLKGPGQRCFKCFYPEFRIWTSASRIVRFPCTRHNEFATAAGSELGPRGSRGSLLIYAVTERRGSRPPAQPYCYQVEYDIRKEKDWCEPISQVD